MKVKDFYPCNYKSVEFYNDQEVSDYTKGEVPLKNVKSRRKSGWSIDKIIETPVIIVKRTNFYPKEYEGVVFNSNSEVSEFFGIPLENIYTRIHLGWSFEKIVETPVVAVGESKVKKFYPQEYKGIILNSDKDVSNHFNIPYECVKSRRGNLGWSIEKIIETPIRKSFPYSNVKNFYPKRYKDVVFYNDEDVSNFSGLPKSLVLNRRNKNWSIEKIVETPIQQTVSRSEEYYPQEYKGVIFIQDEDVANYCGLSRDIIKSRRLKNWSIEKIIETPLMVKNREDSFYPQEYKGIILNSDLEVKEYLNSLGISIQESTVKNRRIMYKNINDMIEKSFSFYPCSYEGNTFYCDKDLAKFLSKSIAEVRKLRKSGKTLQEIINEPNPEKPVSKLMILQRMFPCSVFKESYSSEEEFCLKNNLSIDSLIYYVVDKGRTLNWVVNNQNEEKRIAQEGRSDKKVLAKEPLNTGSKPFWLCDLLFSFSVKECCEKLGITYENIPKKSKTSTESSIIKEFCNTRLKRYEGHVTPDLCIEDFSWNDEKNDYYRCVKEGSLDYLSDYDIMCHRLKYIAVDPEAEDTFNGVYFSEEAVCRFYKLRKSSVKQLQTGKGLSFRDAVLSSLKNMKKRLLISSDGFIVNKSSSDLNISSSSLKKVIKGEISLKEAKSFDEDCYSVVRVTYPIFNKRDVVGHKTKVFPSKKSACKYFGISKASVVNASEGDVAFSQSVEKVLVSKQREKCFVMGLEFQSLRHMSECLGLSETKLKSDLSKFYGGYKKCSQEQFEDYLFNKYFRVRNKNPYFHRKELLDGELIISTYSFTDEKTGLQYFRCLLCNENTRNITAKYFSSRDIMTCVINHYKDSL